MCHLDEHISENTRTFPEASAPVFGGPRATCGGPRVSKGRDNAVQKSRRHGSETRPDHLSVHLKSLQPIDSLYIQSKE